jgi:hypothetical protein
MDGPGAAVLPHHIDRGGQQSLSVARARAGRSNTGAGLLSTDKGLTKQTVADIRSRID